MSTATQDALRRANELVNGVASSTRSFVRSRPSPTVASFSGAGFPRYERPPRQPQVSQPNRTSRGNPGAGSNTSRGMARGVQVICLWPNQSTHMGVLNDIPRLQEAGYGLLPGMKVTDQRPYKVTPKHYPRSLSAEELKGDILRAFPRVISFMFMKPKPNADSLLLLPNDLAPANFKVNLKKARLYVVPTSVRSLEIEDGQVSAAMPPRNIAMDVGTEEEVSNEEVPASEQQLMDVGTEQEADEEASTPEQQEIDISNNESDGLPTMQSHRRSQATVERQGSVEVQRCSLGHSLESDGECLICNQDIAFAESLSQDQEQDRRRQSEAEEERVERQRQEERDSQLLQMREQARRCTPPEAGDRRIQIVFPNQEKIGRNFQTSSSIQDVVNFIRGHENATPHFCLMAFGVRIESRDLNKEMRIRDVIPENQTYHLTWEEDSIADVSEVLHAETESGEASVEREKLHTDLLKVLTGLKKPPCFGSITRGDEWTSFYSWSTADDFKPWHRIDVKIQNKDGVSEGGIDAGGLTKEVLQALMDTLATLGIFSGPDGGKYPTLDLRALKRREYYVAGIVIGLSMIHGGPIPTFLSHIAFDALISGIETVHGALDAASLKQQGIISMDDYVSYSSLQNADDLTMLFGVAAGTTALPTSSACRIYTDLQVARKELGDDLLWNAVIGINAAAYEQMRTALRHCGLSTLLRTNKKAIVRLVSSPPEPLTAGKMLGVMGSMILHSKDNEDRRAQEVVALDWFRQWLKDIEEGAITNVSLSLVFQALTGLKAVGVHKFPQMGIDFIHEEDRNAREKGGFLPTFSTCFNHVYLPVPCKDYAHFKDRMYWGVHGGNGGIYKN